MSKRNTSPDICNPLDDTLAYELRRTYVAINNAYTAALEPHGLRLNEASMLMVIGANPGRTQSDVGRALGIQAANMVALINRLLAAGWIERALGQGRSMSLLLTPQGQELLHAVESAFAALEQRFTRRLSEVEQQQAIQLLRTICKNACCDELDDASCSETAPLPTERT